MKNKKKNCKMNLIKNSRSKNSAQLQMIINQLFKNNKWIKIKNIINLKMYQKIRRKNKRKNI